MIRGDTRLLINNRIFLLNGLFLFLIIAVTNHIKCHLPLRILWVLSYIGSLLGLRIEGAGADPANSSPGSSTSTSSPSAL